MSCLPLRESSSRRERPWLSRAVSWEFISRLLDSARDPSIRARAFLPGQWQWEPGAATEFLSVHEDVPRAAQPRRHPDGPVPRTGAQDAAARYPVASALVRCASDTNFDRICLYLERMPTEFSVLCVRVASLRAPEIHPTAGLHESDDKDHYVSRRPPAAYLRLKAVHFAARLNLENCRFYYPVLLFCPNQSLCQLSPE
jgi:hypothetical protein